MKLFRRHDRTAPVGADQRGVVLLFSLIALAIMSIVAVSLARSFSGARFAASNMGVKRDLQNQSERATEKVFVDFRAAGALATPPARAASLPGSNYSAQMLATNAQGVPTELLKDSAFASVGDSANDIVVNGGGVKIRYLVDRLCASAGDERLLGARECRVADATPPIGARVSNLQDPDPVTVCPDCGPATREAVIFRLSIRVSGPRGVVSVFQSTFTAVPMAAVQTETLNTLSPSRLSWREILSPE